MAIQCTEFRQFIKGTLLGFADLLLPDAGIEIRECSIHEKGGHRWVNLPSKQYEKPDGTKAYSPLIRFPDENRYKAFQRETLKAVNEHIAEPGPAQKEEDDDDIPF